MSMRSYEEFTKEVIQRTILAASEARTEFKAAQKIQSVIRGFLCRRHIHQLNKQASLIQRVYRGYRDRLIYFKILEDAAQKSHLDYFSRHALTIQKLYRGYRSRKNVFDFYRLKLWLKQIVSKGIELEEETWNFFFEERNRKLEESNALARKLCVYIAKKLHHLLRTHHIPGVYSKNKSKALSQIERLLASFSYQDTNRKVAQTKLNKKQQFISKREDLYQRAIDAKPKSFGREEHFRYRDIDAFEDKVRPKEIKVRYSCVPKTGSRPYVKSMLANEKYCNIIMNITRNYDILTPERDFCLNTRIVQNPERIEQFIEVLHDFCVLHDLIEK